MSAVNQIVLHASYAQLTGTNAKEIGVAVPPGRWLLQKAYHVAHEAVTAHDSNNAVLTVKNGATTVATATTSTTGTGNLSISEVSELAISATAGESAVFEGGEALLFDVAKGGTGVSISGNFMASLIKVQ